MNIRAAFIHNVSDALASVGVIIAGTLILLYDWTEADLIVTFIISAYVIYQGATLMGGTIRILMESVPDNVSVTDLVREMSEVDRVEDVHHVHVWELDEQHRALEAHIVAVFDDLEQMEQIKSELKTLLTESFAIDHCTLEMEAPPTLEVASEHPSSVIPPH